MRYVYHSSFLGNLILIGIFAAFLGGIASESFGQAKGKTTPSWKRKKERNQPSAVVERVDSQTQPASYLSAEEWNVIREHRLQKAREDELKRFDEEERKALESYRSKLRSAEIETDIKGKIPRWEDRVDDAARQIDKWGYASATGLILVEDTPAGRVGFVNNRTFAENFNEAGRTQGTVANSIQQSFQTGLEGAYGSDQMAESKNRTKLLDDDIEREEKARRAANKRELEQQQQELEREILRQKLEVEESKFDLRRDALYNQLQYLDGRIGQKRAELGQAQDEIKRLDRQIEDQTAVKELNEQLDGPENEAAVTKATLEIARLGRQKTIAENIRDDAVDALEGTLSPASKGLLNQREEAVNSLTGAQGSSSIKKLADGAAAEIPRGSIVTVGQNGEVKIDTEPERSTEGGGQSSGATAISDPTFGKLDLHHDDNLKNLRDSPVAERFRGRGDLVDDFDRANNGLSVDDRQTTARRLPHRRAWRGGSWK
tara:strand:+ start:1654 stop:3117 length:1464 start_codon:yes stop_codon:yes gene_type:complete